MLINKITVGFVTQVFDTELKRFVSQEFTAGDDCQYENKKGDAVDSDLVADKDGGEAYLPFHMVQPQTTDDDLDAVVERLSDKAESAGLQPEDLDEMVHEMASSIAADVNNEGVDGQIRYLVKEMGAQHAEKQLDELIEERQRKEE